MSFADVTVIDGVRFDVTPEGGSAGARTYIASNVQVQLKWDGQQWTTSSNVNRINTNAQWLIFTISGEWIDQLSGPGRAPALLGEDLKDEAFTVELYPDAGQPKKFPVIAYQPAQAGLLAGFTSGVRSDPDQVRCITKDNVNRSDIEWFRKYG